MSINTDDIKERVHQKKLPENPGVYFFVNKEKEILYIGKATSLKDRVRSYFAKDIAVTRGPKIVTMLKKAADVKWQTTDSVLEALLLEAQLIKKHQPIYNTDEKDDKSFYYVVITKEAFPRVLLVRGRDMKNASVALPELAVSEAKKLKNKIDFATKYIFGPFPQGGSLKEALKIVRKIFPFRDVCKPLSDKACFHAQIGLCPGVCVSAIDAQTYAKTIRNIKLFFEGKKSTIIKNLQKEMAAYAKDLAFEKANEVKKTLFALSHIYDVSLLRKDTLEDALEQANQAHVFRIEAYDVAHLSGKNVVGVMTVLENGIPAKNEYRKFKLTIERNNDVKNLEEILTRRLNHAEWRMPDLIVVDGFALQMNVAKNTMEYAKMNIPVVGVVKDAHHKPKDILGEEAIVTKYADSILLANSEAHRFAIAFHRKRRAKSFLR